MCNDNKEKNLQRIVNNFNKDFETKIDIKNIPFIENVFNNFIEPSSSDTFPNEKVDRLVELETELNNKMDDETLNLFNEWNKLQDDYLLNAIKQAYIYGICSYSQLKKELNFLGGENSNE
jgi:hypothetical protein